MTKFSNEEKLKAVQRVNGGYSLAEVAKETGISERVISNVLHHTERHGWEALSQHRYDWTAEEKLSILQHMKENHWSCAETSVEFGIKGSSTVWQWADRYERYGMAGLEGKKRGRPKKWRPPDETMTREEQLEAENLYLRAENAYLKKLNALVAERKQQEEETKRRPSGS
jgi:transposase-like protein